MLKKLSLVVSAALLLSACGASTAEEPSESVGAVDGALTGIVCGGGDGCGPTSHQAARVCDSSCGYCYSTGNATLCADNTTSYWQCANSSCDPGWHVVSYKCDSACLLGCSGTAPFPANMTQCEANTNDFWQCSTGYCPSGYSDQLGCDTSMSGCGSCDNPYGANVRHCVKL